MAAAGDSRFDTEQELQRYLASIDQDYAVYAQKLYLEGVRTRSQLANAKPGLLESFGIPAIHASDLQAQCQPTAQQNTGGFKQSEVLRLKEMANTPSRKGMSEAGNSDAQLAMNLLGIQEHDANCFYPLPEESDAEAFEYDYSHAKNEVSGNKEITDHHNRALSHFGLPSALKVHDTHTRKNYYKLDLHEQQEDLPAKEYNGGPDGVIADSSMLNVQPINVRALVDNKQSDSDKLAFAKRNPQAVKATDLTKIPKAFDYHTYRNQCILLIVAAELAAGHPIPLLLTDGHSPVLLLNEKKRLLVWQGHTPSQIYKKLVQLLVTGPAQPLPPIPETERFEPPESLASLLDLTPESEKFRVAYEWLKPFAQNCHDEISSETSDQDHF